MRDIPKGKDAPAIWDKGSIVSLNVSGTWIKLYF